LVGADGCNARLGLAEVGEDRRLGHRLQALNLSVGGHKVALNCNVGGTDGYQSGQEKGRGACDEDDHGDKTHDAVD